MDTYEKKYNEALKRARKIHSEIVNNEIIGFPDQIETIFPELAESEDERIRKAIRLILIATEDEQKDFYSTHGLTRKDCTDWLEKQEQKPIRSCDIVPYIDDKIAALQDMWREEKVSFDWDDMKDMIEDVARHFYHKEQKPAEKQDYSGLTDLERAIHRGFLVAGVENVPITIIKETAKDCLAQMKPVEGKEYSSPECGTTSGVWSEEDEKMYTILNSVIKSNIGDTALSNYIDRENLFKLKKWLENRFKSLRPQPKQMPADWTDKDKRILDDISHLLITFKYTEMAKAYKQAIEKLIYQTHLKPSEEQMEALQRAIDACESEWAYQDDELRSLLNDLKKL